jgi:hypothetical protein
MGGMRALAAFTKLDLGEAPSMVCSSVEKEQVLLVANLSALAELTAGVKVANQRV